MQTCVLLSIKPQFVESIMKGEKQYEFRRRVFKRPNVTTVIIYATAPISKVVGEFEIEAIIELEVNNLWEETKSQAGIEETYFQSYFAGRDSGYAIKVGKPFRYAEPKTLIDDFNINFAPQSFIYINL